MRLSSVVSLVRVHFLSAIIANPMLLASVISLVRFPLHPPIPSSVSCVQLPSPSFGFTYNLQFHSQSHAFSFRRLPRSGSLTFCNHRQSHAFSFCHLPRSGSLTSCNSIVSPMRSASVSLVRVHLQSAIPYSVPCVYLPSSPSFGFTFFLQSSPIPCF